MSALLIYDLASFPIETLAATMLTFVILGASASMRTVIPRTFARNCSTSRLSWGCHRVAPPDDVLLHNPHALIPCRRIFLAELEEGCSQFCGQREAFHCDRNN